MTKKLDYIISLLNKEFNSNQVAFTGIDITIFLKKGLKINLSVLEKEVLINPNNGEDFLFWNIFSNKSDNALIISAIERIKNIFLAEQINCAILHLSGSSSK